MSRIQHQPPGRHQLQTSQPGRHQPANLTRVRWIAAAALVVAVALLGLYARALIRPAQVTAVSQPTAASTAARPVLGEHCRALLVAAARMTGHADQVEAQLRGHKQLMDDYKSGRIDRATAFPQGSWWRQALARTLQVGVAAADRYDADKAAYRRLAAQCSKDG
jgi:hypothetical protein